MAKSDKSEHREANIAYLRGRAQDAQQALNDMGMKKLRDLRKQVAYNEIEGLDIGDIKSLIYWQAYIKVIDLYYADVSAMLQQWSPPNPTQPEGDDNARSDDEDRS